MKSYAELIGEVFSKKTNSKNRNISEERMIISEIILKAMEKGNTHLTIDLSSDYLENHREFNSTEQTDLLNKKRKKKNEK